MTEEVQHKTLVAALCEILGQCNAEKYYILFLQNASDNFSVFNGDASVNCLTDSEISINNLEDPQKFHDNLRIKIIPNLSLVEKYYLENINILKAQYGILLFLYSVLTTKVGMCFF